jgi:hypothetical protein
MSEQSRSEPDNDRWDGLRQLGESDPKLLEPLVRARDALSDLAAAMAGTALAAGAELPTVPNIYQPPREAAGMKSGRARSIQDRRLSAGSNLVGGSVLG